MVTFSDELWEEVWERTLDRVERHQVAVAVCRRELPDEPLHRRLVPELARRWRRAARNHAVAHLLWIAFWATIAVSASPGGPAARIGGGMTTFSALVVLVCLLVRRYLVPVARLGT
jgi:hypothetical protein